MEDPLIIDFQYHIWYYFEADMDLYEKISRNPHNVTPKELIELLENYGFEYKNTKGDHALYKRLGYRRFPVPISKNPLAIGIVKEALRLIREIRELERD